MERNRIIKDFREKVSREIDLLPEGLNRFIVETPFTFDDGDHLKIVLKRDKDGEWFLTDEGHTLMHLTYEGINLDTPTRQRIIENALLLYGITSDEGEMRLGIEDGEYGDALYSFVQGLIHISDVSYLKREQVKSAFLDEFYSLIANEIPEEIVELNYTDPVHDSAGLYPVDCRIKGKNRDIFLFAIPNDDRCRDATITILQFEKFGRDFTPAAIFENQENINRKVLSRFSDVTDKQFSTITSARERLLKFLAQHGVAEA